MKIDIAGLARGVFLMWAILGSVVQTSGRHPFLLCGRGGYRVSNIFFRLVALILSNSVVMMPAMGDLNIGGGSPSIGSSYSSVSC